ncbi:MAG: serine hydrolase [Pseudomonadota bacterium]
MCGGAATAVGFGLTGLPGNCLLGRVIEQITGQPYEDFVRQAILKLAGADGMTIAGNLSDRRPMEVAYHGEHAYGMNVRPMDSHGGWIGSAADLIKFAHTVDGIRECRRHRPPERVAFS